MKTYIAKLDRDTVSLDLGFKIAVIRNGQIYKESDITSKFSNFFEEVETKAEEIETPAKEEILLTDDTSSVNITTDDAPGKKYSRNKK